MKLSFKLILVPLIAAVFVFIGLSFSGHRVSTHFGDGRVLQPDPVRSYAIGLQFSPNSKHLLVAMSYNSISKASDTHLRLWDTVRNREIMPLAADGAYFQLFLPNFKTFIVHWLGGHLKLVDIHKRHLDKMLDVGNGGTGTMTISPDKKILVIGKGCEVQIRDARTLGLLRVYHHAAYWTRVRFGDNSRVLRCQWDTSKDQYIDVQTAKRVAAPRSSRAFEVTFSLNKRYFAQVEQKNSVGLWKRSGGKSIKLHNWRTKFVSIQTMQFSPNNKILAVAGASSTITPVQFFKVTS